MGDSESFWNQRLKSCIMSPCETLMRVVTGEFTPDRDVISLNAGVKNLLGSHVLFTQGEEKAITYGYNPGRTFSVSLKWKH